MVVGVKLALEFIDKVREVYGAGSPQYQGFMDVMKDFKDGRANSQETTRRIIALFQGHPELIDGYAVFLPPGNTIHIPADPQENILVTTTTGAMEIARDGTVISDTHTQAPEPQGAETGLPELADGVKHLLENLQIADSKEHKA
ncbi:hypothetical protein BDM02DRAFT_3113132 [Thelephora ganbajun]|uniref:Uncharacterized protein n=1 Tax=Thelephora ganbajun TaxID=370292 RepID=A0ACB6ZK05_THEGA|nr:hypothetical protein BDM02DRAFT_3113132 [Thelephora ganbajun]